MKILGAVAAFILGAFLGAALAKIVRDNGLNTIRITSRRRAKANALIELISQVEREPKLIPFVRSVEILERGSSHVDYRVGFGVGMTLVEALYTKTWDKTKGVVEWKSESGDLRLRHSGRIRFPSDAGQERIELNTEYGFGIPILGPLLTATVAPAVKFALALWLRRLGDR
ncbi:MAG: hypothetical protein Q7T82_19715 [Armatimonadota bacterium]|nr:hypothetical protein [Armatimonadota bacterium]